MPDLKYCPLSLLDENLLLPLMLEEQRAWMADLSWDYSSVCRILASFAKQKMLPGFVALDDNKAVGYTYFIINSGKGIIGAVFASKSSSSQETAQNLIGMAASSLKETKGVIRIEAQIMPFNDIDLAAAFVPQGFNHYKRTYLDLDLAERRNSMELPPMGKIIAWNSAFVESAAEMNMLSYQNQADAELCEDYRTKAGCESYLRSLIENPGCGIYMPEASFMALDSQNSVSGLIICTRISENAAMIPQISIHPSHQGKGLGGNLMHRTLLQLKSMGLSRVVLTATQKNHRAFEWYQRLGFKPRKEFGAFVWER
jgi:ribosomal protein S18 acetylase RimI-like enzyme